MKNYRIILIIGIIEILLGSSALLGNFITLLLGINDKTPNVLLFVAVAGSISTLLGIGILKFNKRAYQILLYFSTVIILSKICILLDIIQLNGALEVSVHRALSIPLSETFKNFMADLKNWISIIYHAAIIYYLSKKEIQTLFLHD